MQKALFIPFSKVDSVRREVSGVVTAEAPDKDREVCDYEKSKPYYQAVIAEIGKATDGQNFFPLREMHGLKAAGKCIGFNFNDPEKEIEMTFKVVDDDAWKKVEERVYTGFSQGGRKIGDQTPDPVYKGCMRYVAAPSEVSLVDNPCYPGAHFAYVKADGSTEMRKFLRTEIPADTSRIDALEEQIGLLKAASIRQDVQDMTAGQPYLAKKKTKRVAGEDLPQSAFAYVGDPDKTETWKLPIKFSSEAKSKSHVRNALARFNQTQGIPASEKGKVRAKIVSAARKYGIDVSEENEKMAAVTAIMQKAIRRYVNAHNENIVSPGLKKLDAELGKILHKGMYDVSTLACSIEQLARLVYCCACEQEWEGDEDSVVPGALADNVADLASTLIAMVDEETRELVAEVRSHVA